MKFRTVAIVFLIGLLIGFVPMWLRARQRTGERDQALHNLQISQLQNQLSAAALDSRRGQYETARGELSQFFSSLNADVKDKRDVDFSPGQLRSFDSIFSERDDLIALLARNDPASADRLSNLDEAFRKALASK